MDLGIDLNPAVLRYHLIGDRNTLEDRNALLYDGVVLHVRHAQHTINLLDTQPVQDVRH